MARVAAGRRVVLCRPLTYMIEHFAKLYFEANPSMLGVDQVNILAGPSTATSTAPPSTRSLPPPLHVSQPWDFVCAFCRSCTTLIAACVWRDDHAFGRSWESKERSAGGASLGAACISSSQTTHIDHTVQRETAALLSSAALRFSVGALIGSVRCWIVGRNVHAAYSLLLVGVAVCIMMLNASLHNPNVPWREVSPLTPLSAPGVCDAPRCTTRSQCTLATTSACY